MIAGVDTGFFFTLEERHPEALKVWREQEIVTSVIVLYELQKKILQGQFRKWPSILDDIRLSVFTVALTDDISLKAGHVAHKYGLPGLDALILASLLDANVKHIYTTDAHFELYKEKGIEIINLSPA
jgi:predicted nucleic acid-binding protein